jgi:hypothetical protein
LLGRLRDDAESNAQQLETGQFKVFSIAIDGEAVDCTRARAKVLRELAKDLESAIHYALEQDPTGPG